MQVFYLLEYFSKIIFFMFFMFWFTFTEQSHKDFYKILKYLKILWVKKIAET